MSSRMVRAGILVLFIQVTASVRPVPDSSKYSVPRRSNCSILLLRINRHSRVTAMPSYRSDFAGSTDSASACQRRPSCVLSSCNPLRRMFVVELDRLAFQDRASSTSNRRESCRERSEVIGTLLAHSSVSRRSHSESCPARRLLQRQSDVAIHPPVAMDIDAPIVRAANRA